MKLRNNPKAVYSLTTLVIIVWTTVIIRLFSYDNNPRSFANKIVVAIERRDSSKIKEPHKLLLNYRDPFLKRQFIAAKGNQYISGLTDIDTELPEHKMRITQIEKQVQEPQVELPEICFTGLYCNATQNRKVAIIKVDEKRLVIEEGDKFQRIKVCSIEHDSIILELSGQQLIVKKVDE